MIITNNIQDEYDINKILTPKIVLSTFSKTSLSTGKQHTFKALNLTHNLKNKLIVIAKQTSIKKANITCLPININGKNLSYDASQSQNSFTVPKNLTLIKAMVHLILQTCLYKNHPYS